MSLEEFLSATEGIPVPALRSAMVAALAVEAARTPEAYPRFYERVLDRLGLSAAGSAEPAAQVLSRAAS